MSSSPIADLSSLSRRAIPNEGARLDELGAILCDTSTIELRVGRFRGIGAPLRSSDGPLCEIERAAGQPQLLLPRLS